MRSRLTAVVLVAALACGTLVLMAVPAGARAVATSFGPSLIDQPLTRPAAYTVPGVVLRNDVLGIRTKCRNAGRFGIICGTVDWQDNPTQRRPARATILPRRSAALNNSRVVARSAVSDPNLECSFDGACPAVVMGD